MTQSRVEPPLLTEEDYACVRRYAQSNFACGSLSVHGPTHWARVERAGLVICRENGADETVVRLFAILHDSCRLNDNDDPGHGPRAADLLGSLVDVLITIDPERLALLEQAIRHHTNGFTTDDPTIGACWDADRLDLGRVGKIPAKKYMSTDLGRMRVDLI